MICRYTRSGILTKRRYRRQASGKHTLWTRRGLKVRFRVEAEVPDLLRYQRFQFTHIKGRSRKRSYRSGLEIEPPQSLEQCRALLGPLAKKIHFRNVSVDVEDMVQIGEIVILERVQDFERRGIRPTPEAWIDVLRDARKEMFHAIDQELVLLGSGRASDDRWESGDDLQEVCARLLESGRRSRGLRNQFAGLEEAFSSWDAEEWQDPCQRAPVASCNFTVFCEGSGWGFFPDCRESWGAPLPPGSCQPRPRLACESPWHLPLVDKFWGGESLRTLGQPSARWLGTVLTSKARPKKVRKPKTVRREHDQPFCIFKPYSTEERTELYRRVWGPSWEPSATR